MDTYLELTQPTLFIIFDELSARWFKSLNSLDQTYALVVDRFVPPRLALSFIR